MTGSAGDPTREFAQWLAKQGDILQRLAQERDPARLRAELEAWWRRAGAQAGPQAQDLASRFFDLGERYLQGLQQFARAASGERPPGNVPGGNDQGSAGGFDFGLDFLAAWRRARWNNAGGDAASAVFAPWLEAMASLPPSGATRDFVNDARELAELRAQCQRIEAALTKVLEGLQHTALADLQARIAERAPSADPVRDFHELYKLWVECGERAYAQGAHDPEFIRLQADFTNHALRIRILQRRIAERMARSLDLPTRAEVNALHLQVRDLKRRLSRHDAAAGGTAAADGSQARAAKKAKRT